MLITLRKDTDENWFLQNPVLDIAEAGYAIDSKRLKIGDGVTNWNALHYATRQYSEYSAAQTPLINAARVVAHGLIIDAQKLKPEGVDWYAQVTTAFAGYAVGDRIYSFAANMPTFACDNTNMIMLFQTALPTVKTKTGGTAAAVSIGTNVRLYMRAFR